jgi:sensor domain CHASE-containing protein
MYSKTKKTIFLSVAFIISSLSVNAQALLQFSQTEKPSFKQMQRDLAAWKDTTNLQESKNWKYIKTMGSGYANAYRCPR